MTDKNPETPADEAEKPTTPRDMPQDELLKLVHERQVLAAWFLQRKKGPPESPVN